MNTNIMFLDIIHRSVYLKHRPVYFSNHNVWETGFCLRLHVKPNQLSPIDTATPYIRTPVPATGWRIQANHNTNHLRELKEH
jgi:hypothetical protein